MPKISKELFELLSEPKTFDTTIELIEAFQSFENDIIATFWVKLFDYFSQLEQLGKWKITHSIDNWEISFFYESEDNNAVYFYIYFRSRYMIFGLQTNRNNTIVDFDKLYANAKLMVKGKGWRTSTFASREMPIFFEYKTLDETDHSGYKKFLPIFLDDIVKEVANDVLNRFTKEIQDFIIDNLKPEPPEIYTLETNA